MPASPDQQFDSLESAYQYIAVLTVVLEETQQDINAEVVAAERAHASRRLDALQLVSFKLERLRHHLESSRRLLNDLRMLRRVLQVDAAEDTAGAVSYNQEDARARNPK